MSRQCKLWKFGIESYKKEAELTGLTKVIDDLCTEGFYADAHYDFTTGDRIEQELQEIMELMETRMEMRRFNR